MMDTELRSAGERTRAHFEADEVPPFVRPPIEGPPATKWAPRVLLVAAVIVVIAAMAAVAGPLRDDGTADGVADVEVVPDTTTPTSTPTTVPTTVTTIDPALVAPVGLPIAISPQFDLRDGQTIQVTGESFPPATTVYIGQCTPLAGPEPTIDRCMTSRFVTVNSDDQGRFAATFEVQRLLNIGGTTYDCIDPPVPGDRAACNLVAAPLASATENGQVPLYFDPDAPLVERPAISLGQIDGLVDFQVVDVTVTDPDEGSWAVNQCVTADTGPRCIGSALLGQPYRSLVANGGQVETQIVVRRWIGDIDCMAEGIRCSIVGESQTTGNPGEILGQRINFAEGSMAPPVALRADRQTVAAGQALRLAADGLVLGQVDPWLCTTGAIQADSCVPMWQSDASNSPTGTVVLVEASTDQIRTPTGPIVGCGAPGACEVVLFDVHDRRRIASTPIVVTAPVASKLPGTGTFSTTGILIPDSR